MAYKTLVVKCPTTGQELDVGNHLPLNDPLRPTGVRNKTLLLPIEIIACPICGKPHSFSKEEEIREVIVSEEEVGTGSLQGTGAVG